MKRNRYRIELHDSTGAVLLTATVYAKDADRAIRTTKIHARDLEIELPDDLRAVVEPARGRGEQVKRSSGEVSES